MLLLLLVCMIRLSFKHWCTRFYDLIIMLWMFFFFFFLLFFLLFFSVQGFTIFGETFAYVTIFNPTIEVVTLRLRG